MFKYAVSAVALTIGGSFVAGTLFVAALRAALEGFGL